VQFFEFLTEPFSLKHARLSSSLVLYMERASKNLDVTLRWKIWAQLDEEQWKSMDEIVGSIPIQKEIYKEMIVFLRQDIEMVLALLLKNGFIEKSEENYRRHKPYSSQSNTIQPPVVEMDASAAE